MTAKDVLDELDRYIEEMDANCPDSLKELLSLLKEREASE